MKRNYLRNIYMDQIQNNSLRKSYKKYFLKNFTVNENYILRKMSEIKKKNVGPWSRHALTYRSSKYIFNITYMEIESKMSFEKKHGTTHFT